MNFDVVVKYLMVVQKNLEWTVGERTFQMVLLTKNAVGFRERFLSKPGKGHSIRRQISVGHAMKAFEDGTEFTLFHRSNEREKLSREQLFAKIEEMFPAKGGADGEKS